MMNDAWLGIDTSNYTTSIALVVSDGRYYNIKIPLCVKPNEKGVRQSDAVFMHVKNLPEAIKKLNNKIKKDYRDGLCYRAVGVSTKPRNVMGSYMPCFLSGVSTAVAIAEMLNVPLYEFSHQEGHIQAALYGASVNAPETFYSFHLSGGTCELLEVCRTNNGFDGKIIAESLDITLGQLVDRVGVMLGLHFPCGVELEKLAIQSNKNYKIIVKGEGSVNLSGFENKIEKMHNDGVSKFDIARYVYSVIYQAVKIMLTARTDASLPVLFAGGVSGSLILQNEIKNYCNAYFSPSSLSSDNAVGIALLAKNRELNNEQ